MDAAGRAGKAVLVAKQAFVHRLGPPLSLGVDEGVVAL